MEPKIIRLSAKCVDSFNATLLDSDSKIMGQYSGYVPKFMPGNHYGDYI